MLLQGQAERRDLRAIHLAVRQNDFRDAADHGDEVEDIPSVSEIVLPSAFSHGSIR